MPCLTVESFRFPMKMRHSQGPFSIYQWGGGDDLKFSVSEKMNPPLKFFRDLRSPPLEKFLNYSHPPLKPENGYEI